MLRISTSPVVEQFQGGKPADPPNGSNGRSIRSLTNESVLPAVAPNWPCSSNSWRRHSCLLDRHSCRSGERSSPIFSMHREHKMHKDFHAHGRAACCPARQNPTLPTLFQKYRHCKQTTCPKLAPFRKFVAQALLPAGPALMPVRASAARLLSFSMHKMHKDFHGHGRPACRSARFLPSADPTKFDTFQNLRHFFKNTATANKSLTRNWLRSVEQPSPPPGPRPLAAARPRPAR